jgi:hypothetical protein
MANLYDSSALSSLNEKDYINKLYDTNTDTTKKLLEQYYTDNSGALNTEQERVGQTSDDYVNRTLVEAKKAQDVGTVPMSTGAKAQEALVRGNAQQANVTDLQKQRSEADAEIERQRQLLGSKYAAAIQKAQADNDMERAQQLYDAAKAEEAQLLQLKMSASSVLAGKGDTTLRDSLLSGKTPSADYSGNTWGQVLKNEDSINEVYDNKLLSQQLELQMQNEEAISDLEAKRRQQEMKADENLTKTYVDAMKKAKNYAEVQNAYGMGSGAMGQAQIAQDADLQNALTNLRRAQLSADAGVGLEGFDINKAYRDKLVEAQKGVDSERAGSLLDAAEKEEQVLLQIQQQIGQELAAQNDWSVLGKLYGLTKDQIDRIQGTGIYAPVDNYDWYAAALDRGAPPKPPEVSAADLMWLRNEDHGTTSGGIDWSKLR